MSLFLAGDVMLGRGVDQVLSHPGDPTLREPHVTDARDYVRLAERRNGPIDRPVPDTWPWGDLLATLERERPSVRVINLETAVTTSSDFAVGKSVHYRMHPANIGALEVVRPDVCALANNHVLDFGPAGLVETLDVLDRAGLRYAGAGRSAGQARRPVAVPLAGGRRVLVIAVGTVSSGIPARWAAGPDRPGVALVDPSDPADAEEVLAATARARAPGDVVVVSIHWGANWGYRVPSEQVRFAHRLVEGGVDVVHGHSSHHPRGIEVHRGRLIVYGAGDLVDDYEGISGYEEYRDDLRVAYLPTLTAGGELEELRMAVFQARRLRLRQATDVDRDLVAERLLRRGGDAVTLVAKPGGVLVLRPR